MYRELILDFWKIILMNNYCTCLKYLYGDSFFIMGTFHNNIVGEVIIVTTDQLDLGQAQECPTKKKVWLDDMESKQQYNLRDSLFVK